MKHGQKGNIKSRLDRRSLQRQGSRQHQSAPLAFTFGALALAALAAYGR